MQLEDEATLEKSLDNNTPTVRFNLLTKQKKVWGISQAGAALDDTAPSSSAVGMDGFNARSQLLGFKEYHPMESLASN